MDTLGAKLAQARKKSGYNQEQVAAMLSIRRQTYSAYERNVSVPDALTLGKLAQLFKVSTDELLGLPTPQAEEKAPKSIEDLPLAPGAKALKQPTISMGDFETIAAHSDRDEPLTPEGERQLLLTIEKVLRKHNIINGNGKNEKNPKK